MSQTILGRVKGSMWYTGTADTAADLQSELTTAGNIALKNDLYLNRDSANLYAYLTNGNSLSWQLIGNIKGAAGRDFKVDIIYKSVAALNAGYANDGVVIGGFAIINTGDVEDEDNAKLYVKGTSAYEYLTDLSGSAGIQGPASVFSKSATASTGGAGTNPTVSLTGSGTVSDPYKFSFTIPKGDTGETGAAGVGVSAVSSGSTSDSDGYTKTPLTFTMTDKTSSTVTVSAKNGVDGAKGDKGDTGEAAGFGTPTATVTNTVGTPTVSVTSSGTNTAKVFKFAFTNLKGEKGDTGAAGADGKTPSFEINDNGELIAVFE
jgi:hypothetical protein